jgi:hypothetical protein
LAQARKNKSDPGKSLREQGKKWLDRIEAAGKAEKKWLDDAKKAVDAYTGEGSTEATGSTYVSEGNYDFNILFSNVETIVPAVINSAPVPDIRRRFNDPDPAARVVSQILERAIRIQIDDSRLQVEMEASAQDSFLAGRGVVRLRYYSDVVGGEPTSEDIEDAADNAAEGLGSSDSAQGGYGAVGQDDYNPGEDLSGLGTVSSADQITDPSAASGFGSTGLGGNGGPPLETLANERICFEAVSWLDYRHGPAKRWSERPWDAFRFCIPRDEESKSFDSGLIGQQLSTSELNKRNNEDELSGWEVWDEASRSVIFIDDNGVVLKTIDDPLGLSGFFCITQPMQPIEVNGRLMPVNPFSIYRRLANDLDDAVRRKNILIRAMKAKGWYGISEADMQAILDLEDNAFAPIKDPEIFAANGGLQSAVAFWPMEKFIPAINQLDLAIQTYKSWIYEITGISDIVRGASQASETATAQNIKSQWGSLRIQKMQRMMERCARDLFVMMAEIIPAKFSPQTLEKMTGIPILPTPQDMPDVLQQKNAVMALLKEKLSTYFRIDVESDSTIRADLTQQKQEVSQFLQGAAVYFKAVAPLVQEGALPAEAAVEIFASTARMFNLGRSVEDTIEEMVTTAKAKSEAMKQQQAQQQGQPPPPDPNTVKVQGELQLAQQKQQGEADKAAAHIQQQAQASRDQNQVDIAKAKMTNDMEWRKAVLSSLTQIETAKIAAKSELDSAGLAAQLEGILGLTQMQHEKELAVINGQISAAQPQPVPQQSAPPQQPQPAPQA